MDALLSSPIRFVTTRHEQGAAFMADVYGRLTGRAGVCMLHKALADDTLAIMDARWTMPKTCC